MSNSITRRTVAKGAAWSVPAVIATAAVPSYAASPVQLCQNTNVTISKKYELTGITTQAVDNFKTDGKMVHLDGDGSSTWKTNPGYYITFTYMPLVDLDEFTVSINISGNYYSGTSPDTASGQQREGRVMNVYDMSFNNGLGYRIDSLGSAAQPTVITGPGQIGQIRGNELKSQRSDGAFVGMGLNHSQNEEIYRAYDAKEIVGQFKFSSRGLKAGEQFTVTLWSRFAEPNNYDYMSQTFGAYVPSGQKWIRPILDAGSQTNIKFTESTGKLNAKGTQCVMSSGQDMAVYNGDLKNEQKINSSVQ